MADTDRGVKAEIDINMEEAVIETLEAKPRGSLAPLLILMIVIGFQFVSKWIELLKKVYSYSYKQQL